MSTSGLFDNPHSSTSPQKHHVDKKAEEPDYGSTKALFETTNKSEAGTEEDPKANSGLLVVKNDAHDRYWVGEAFQLSPQEIARISNEPAHTSLAEALGTDNEAFYNQLVALVENPPQGEQSMDIGQALSYKLDEIRLRALRAGQVHQINRIESVEDQGYVIALKADNDIWKEKYNKLVEQMEDLDAYRKEEKRDAATWEREEKVSVRSFAGNRSVSLDPNINIEVPKQYRPQLSAAELKVFEGGSDMNVVFKFIKSLDFHIDTLESVFNELQKIEYTISYLRGTPRIWAKEWRNNTKDGNRTWSNLMIAFKDRWLPDNAHLHLLEKLERAELKRGSVDTFNDEYRQTLGLMGIDNLRKDSNVLLSLQQHSMATKGGLNLEQLMDYASKLLMRQPKLMTIEPRQTNNYAKNASSSSNTAKTKKPQVITINNVEDGNDDFINAIAESSNRDRGPRECYACGATDHLISHCDPEKRKAFWGKVNKKRAEMTAGKE
ncbi:hypothetical protein BJ508DRAFT_308289 [Ascobolus immersus RN42]|uniref:Ty3 transposon capsid-like protein domain-containing protein n=1 Tax=Ascobolus immersus RN42 TaxID=1160509 RepID=A0A3N4I291_ASCIM|nr:hypothetical protein BJ508DRAFT_308289 [Ascobolus immersus RN42]